MAQDHFETPPDPKRSHIRPNKSPKSAKPAKLLCQTKAKPAKLLCQNQPSFCVNAFRFDFEHVEGTDNEVLEDVGTDNEDVGTDKDKREMQPRKMVSDHMERRYQKWRMERWIEAQGLDPAHHKQGFVHRGSCGN